MDRLWPSHVTVQSPLKLNRYQKWLGHRKFPFLNVCSQFSLISMFLKQLDLFNMNKYLKMSRILFKIRSDLIHAFNGY